MTTSQSRTGLPPVPYQSPIVTENRVLTNVWDKWFRQLIYRVGGNTALTNLQLAAQGVGQNGTLSIAKGAASAAVEFSTDFSDTNYIATVSLENSIDPTPRFLQLLITDKNTSGFTVSFNAPTDTANYILHYRTVEPSAA